MKKLRLNVDELAVESFAVAAGDALRGTVLARAGANGEPCPRTDESTCDPHQACGCIPSWAISCAGASSCDAVAGVADADVAR
jgi:hypothetical protein